MKTIDKGTLTRTILLWLAILNQVLTALGKNPLPLDDNTVSTVITTVFALWAWWKNNDFTHAAKKGTELTRSLKNGDSVQVVKASGADNYQAETAALDFVEPKKAEVADLKEDTIKNDIAIPKGENE